MSSLIKAQTHTDCLSSCSCGLRALVRPGRPRILPMRTPPSIHTETASSYVQGLSQHDLRVLQQRCCSLYSSCWYRCAPDPVLFPLLATSMPAVLICSPPGMISSALAGPVESGSRASNAECRAYRHCFAIRGRMGVGYRVWS
jgi:hypothetical protein